MPTTTSTLLAVAYLIVRPLARTDWFSKLVPPIIVSACDCLSPRMQDWTDTFESVTAAREARDRLFQAEPDLRILGMGLPDELASSFPADPSRHEAVLFARRQPLAPGGQLLGFEPLSVADGAPGCSWLCNALETHCADALGIRPNGAGMLDSLEEARRCCAEIEREEVGAEPGPWLPFAVVDYTGPAPRT